MNTEQFDQFARGLKSVDTRRSVVRAVAGIVAGLVAGAVPRLTSRAADPPPPIPPGSLDPWPACSQERTHYCVAAFSVDGVDQLVEAPEYHPNVIGANSTPDSVIADRLEWFTHPTSGDLQPADLEKEIVLRVRTGRLEPVVTIMRAAGVHMRTAGDAATGWEIEVQGRPSLVPSFGNQGPSEQATTTFVWFSGQSLHRTEPSVALWNFEGYMAATGVSAFGAPQWTGAGWAVILQSPHLMPDGSMTHGSYTAWMTPEAIGRLGLTTPLAVAGGLAVTRTDEGVETPVDALISERLGGVLVEIPKLTFSSPEIAIRKRGGIACAKRCRKGRVCKNGTCVKKRRKKR